MAFWTAFVELAAKSYKQQKQAQQREEAAARSAQELDAQGAALDAEKNGIRAQIEDAREHKRQDSANLRAATSSRSYLRYLKKPNR